MSLLGQEDKNRAVECSNQGANQAAVYAWLFLAWRSFSSDKYALVSQSRQMRIAPPSEATSENVLRHWQGVLLKIVQYEGVVFSWGVTGLSESNVQSSWSLRSIEKSYGWYFEPLTQEALKTGTNLECSIQ